MITILVALVLLGLLMYVVPMDDRIKTTIVVLVVLWLILTFAGLSPFPLR